MNKVLQTDSTYGKVVRGKLFHNWSTTQMLVFASIMAALASLLQAAGGYIPVFGFAISPFTTLPICIATIMFFRYGLFSYVLTIFLLLLLEPMELFIFPFTTGLLGITLGWSLTFFRQRIIIISLNSVVLFLGICLPLLVLQFPVFGPMTAENQSLIILVVIYLFSFIYAVLWYFLAIFSINKLVSFF